MKYTLAAFLGLAALGLKAQSVSPVVVCSLPSVNNESSGIERTGPNQFWSHNDSGGQPQLYEFDSTGVLIKTLTVTNATNIDWEEIAQGDNGEFYIGDFGNNNNDRSVANGNPLKIYLITDPDLLGTSTTAQTLQFEYEDRNFSAPSGNHNFDMEAFFFFDDSLHLFTKNRTSPTNGWIKHYVLPAQAGTYTAMLVDSFNNGGTRITAADMSLDGRTVSLVGNDRIYLFSCFEGTHFLSTSYVRTLTMPNTQKEAVVFGTNTTLYLTDEQTTTGTRKLYRVPVGSYIDAPVVISSASIGSTCFSETDGTIAVSTSGGTAPYSYLWSNGNTTGTNTALSAGSYTVIITDSHGCSIDSSFAVSTFPQATLTASVSNSCADSSSGSITLNMVGPSPFTYAWSNGNTTAANTPLLPGNYPVTVTDVNGCEIDSSFTVNSFVPVTVSAVIDSTCYSAVDGAVALNVSGDGPFAYAWSNGNTTSSPANLAQGTYTVIVTDVHGCSIDTSFAVEEFPQLLLTAQIDSTCPESANGSVAVQVMNATGPYTWSWSNGDTTSTIGGLPAGSYTLQFTDAHGCEADSVFSVSDYVVAAPVVHQDYTALISTFAGVNTWYLNGSIIPGETNDTITFSQNGYYQAGYTDANGCFVISDSVLVLNTGMVSNEPITLHIFREQEAFVFTNTAAERITVAVYSMDGKLCDEVSVAAGETVRVKLEAQALYVLRCGDSNGNLNWTGVR